MEILRISHSRYNNMHRGQNMPVQNTVVTEGYCMAETEMAAE